MITDTQKIEIGRLIVLELDRHDGSWIRLSKALGVAEGTIRYNMQDAGKWKDVSDKMWAKIAAKLDYDLHGSWNVVITRNVKLMMDVLYRAQNEQLFMAVSEDAGHGKSAGCRLYMTQKDCVYYLECEESWSHKRFVQKTAEVLGLSIAQYGVSELTDMIVNILYEKAIKLRPLMIFDEANKLKPASLRFFITLFNKLEDKIGVVLVGAHDLKKHIRHGVRRDGRGFDELESRFGRTYIPLVGIFESDVRAICQANGLTDEQAIKRVWWRLDPEQKSIEGRPYMVATQDLRVLKQAVKHERLAFSGDNPTPPSAGTANA